MPQQPPRRVLLEKFTRIYVFVSLIYVINQDLALKATETAYPGVEVRAIQDDITLIGDPMHVWADDGALAFILSHLKDRGLTPNQGKCQALGSTPNACANKPDWLREPITIENHDGVMVEARGIKIYKNPIGENDYSCTHLTKKFTNISSAINNSYIALSKVSPHAAYLALIFSYQNLFDD